MGLRTLLFAAFIGVAFLGLLVSPIWGILGYVGHYSIGPERQWWHAPLSGLGIRYSFMLAICTAASMAMHWSKLRYGERFFLDQEKLLLVFLAVVWALALIGPETVGRYTSAGVDHPSVKLTKIAIFALMLSHVVTTRKNLNLLLWVLTVGGLILGMQAWDTPYRAFSKGRLDRVGGPDFAEANFFAAYMACLLWLIGVQFLRSNWKGKLACFVAGGFTANAVVLTRSRGAVVGLAAGGLMALIAAPREHRKYILGGMLLAGAGFYSLTDDAWHGRTSTILVEEGERDESANSRIVLAKAGLRMWANHPLGVGPGNFYQNIGNYVPEYAGKDAHNTFVRCLTELGAVGLIVFGLLIINAFRTLRSAAKLAADLPPKDQKDMQLLAFGLQCALATLLACCLTVSLTYVEFVWWFLMFPVCLQRTVANLLEDHAQAGLLDSPELAT